MSTRHERKEATRKALSEQLDAQQRFEREHPVKSGKVRVVDYVEPFWRYVKPAPLRNQLALD
jgi:hypothetical protein